MTAFSHVGSAVHFSYTTQEDNQHEGERGLLLCVLWDSEAGLKERSEEKEAEENNPMRSLYMV